MARHNANRYYVVGEGVLCFDDKSAPATVRPSSTEELTSFRFSRLGKKGPVLPEALRKALAVAMTAPVEGQDDPNGTPAGFTYVGQFLDHDMTKDATKNIKLGDQVTVEQLEQGRSPALDLDSLYGFGPSASPEFYRDGIRLVTGTSAVSVPTPEAGLEHPGADLPRRTATGTTPGERRVALIPDGRNDENLAVAQLHAAFIRFHNMVVDDLAAAGKPQSELFDLARDTVTRHYQWMIRHDYLPRIVDPAVVDDVFTNGRKFFEVPPPYDTDYTAYTYGGGGGSYIRPGDATTIPVEFTVAAFRLGHSMIRADYQWNKIFRVPGLIPNGQGSTVSGTLDNLFRFTGTSGNLAPNGNPNDPELGADRLPSNWVADFRRLFDFTEAGRPDLVARDANGTVELNVAKRLDTLLVNPLDALPLGSFGGRDTAPVPAGIDLNLAFRNLTRAGMVELASGRQMAEALEVTPLTADELLTGTGDAADLSAMTPEERNAIAADPPLWFYILREAELNNGLLAGVGARIVAEVFHRAIEGSRTSIVRDPSWRPTLGPDAATFRMTDLLLTAFGGDAALINPMGD